MVAVTKSSYIGYWIFSLRENAKRKGNSNIKLAYKPQKACPAFSYRNFYITDSAFTDFL